MFLFSLNTSQVHIEVVNGFYFEPVSPVVAAAAADYSLNIKRRGIF